MKSKLELERSIQHDKKAILIINTHSRKGSDLFELAKKEIKKAGFTLTASFRVDDPRQLNAIISKAMVDKPTLLIVGSGDGTISEVVDHLAYTDTVLGFIPLGTTNNFARSIGIPLSFEDALQNIFNGKVADIDLGKVNNDYFANVASIGISVDVAANVSDSFKKRIGRAAYTITGIKTLLKHKYFKVTVSSEHQRQNFYTHQLVIANGRSHAGRLIARDASIDSHELVIFRIGGQGKFPFILSTVRYALTKKQSIAQKSYTTATEVTIKTNPIQKIEIDGEIKTKTPAKVSIANEALKIMVPTGFRDR